MKRFLLFSALFVLALSQSTDRWVVIQKPIATIAMGVGFIDYNTGVVVGADNRLGSVILRTADGGQTWIDTLDSEESMMYTGVTFTDYYHGAAAGLGLLDIIAGKSYTADAGQSWKPSDDRNMECDWMDVESVPGNDEMVVLSGEWEDLIGGAGNGVAISMNQGKDYKHVDWKSPVPCRYNSFVDENTGFVSGGSWPEAGTEASMFVPRGVEIVKRLSHRVALVRDEKNNVVLSYLPTTKTKGEFMGYEALIQRTDDGGNTWNAVFNDTGSFYFNGISFIDAKNGWVAAEGYSRKNGSQDGAFIFHTSDGGNTWEEQIFIPDGSLFTVKMFNKMEGWAGGAVISGARPNGLLYHTTDGGKTWDLTTLEGYYINYLDLLDPDHVYATAFGLADSSLLAYLPTNPSDSSTFA